jgi:hypothetical protein
LLEKISPEAMSLSAHFVLEDVGERVGRELIAGSLVELVLELDPVQAECV